jgi:hypothetical protein
VPAATVTLAASVAVAETLRAYCPRGCPAGRRFATCNANPESASATAVVAMSSNVVSGGVPALPYSVFHKPVIPAEQRFRLRVRTR